MVHAILGVRARACLFGGRADSHHSLRHVRNLAGRSEQSVNGAAARANPRRVRLPAALTLERLTPALARTFLFIAGLDPAPAQLSF
jgi:hypothetical protein